MSRPAFDSLFAPVLDALELPPAAEVDQRIPKKLLLEHGAPTGTDKRLIEAHVQALNWEATLKPQTVAIPEYVTPTQVYSEVAVLTLTLRDLAPDSSKAARLMELVHRAIPYPLLLISAALPAHPTLGISLAHKRRSQAASEQVVLEDAPQTIFVGTQAATASHRASYFTALDVAEPPAAHLHALYDRWMRAGLAYLIAQITGQFILPTDAQAPGILLSEYQQTEREIKQLRAQAGREKQLSRSVTLNLRVRALEQRKTELAARLRS